LNSSRLPTRRTLAHEWQMTMTAQAIGISRKNLWERLRRLHLVAPKRALDRELRVAED